MKYFYFLFTLNLLNIQLLLSATYINFDSQVQKTELAPTTLIQPAFNGYEIFIPGKEIEPGKFTPAQIIRMHKLEQKYYLPSKIYLKTKKKYFIDKYDKGFPSSTIQSSLSGIQIKSIRTPFNNYIGDGIQSEDKFGLSRIYEIDYITPIDPYDICKELVKNPEIEYATPVFIYYTNDFLPNDPLIASQWAINNIQLPKAWEITKGNKDVLIAIVDTGTDTEHVDLKANIWTNPKEIPNNGIDDDGNGKIDDVIGWDFVGDITQNQALAGQYFEDNNPKPKYTNNSHGTHTAGCASAVTNNGVGIAGTGFNCRIIPIKCAADDGSVRGIFRGYEGILYAAYLGAHFINCSWGGPGYSPVHQDIINQAFEMGSLVLTSAGNESLNLDIDNMYPANYVNIMNVGSSSSNNQRSNFSNYGHNITVYAPGNNIYATMPGNQYANQSGTSMASPVAAGVCGLIKSVMKDFTPQKVLRQIRSTSDNVMTTDPKLRPILYGRVNAYKAVAYNNPAFPDLKVPGVTVSKFTIEGKDYLSDFKQTYINITLTNYLADVTDLNVKITPLDNFISVSLDNFPAGLIKTDQSRNFDFTVKLLDNNPWFSGFARILLTYESGDYIDYDLLKIPIKIESPNIFALKYTVPDWLTPTWFASTNPDYNTYWCAGRTIFGGTAVRVGGPGGGKNDIFGSDPLTAIFAFDASNAFVATGTANSTGNSTIYRTTNAGLNWSQQSIGSITGFVNDIHFFDSQNGIILGDPKSNKWGIAKTTDGGQSWTQVINVSSPIGTENGIAGSSYWLGDIGWFGSTSGRVFKTTDRGNTWQAFNVVSGNPILRIFFLNENEGIAIYSAQFDQTSPRYVASTQDGGKTWRTGVYEFSKLAPDAIHLFSPPRSNAIFVLCSGGQVYKTHNLGRNWSAILSQQSQGATTGSSSFGEQFSVRVWQSSTNFEYLEFQSIPADAKRQIILLSDSTLNFDTVMINNSKSDNVEIKNTGEVQIEFSNIEIIPQGDTELSEFQFFIAPVKTIYPDKTQKYRIKFTPSKEGLRTAQLRFTGNAEGLPLTINLIGYGIDSQVSVEHTRMDNHLINIYPIPAKDIIAIKLPLNSKDNANVQLFDIYGKLVENKEYKIIENTIQIPVNQLSDGIYSIKLFINNLIYTYKFIKIE